MATYGSAAGVEAILPAMDKLTSESTPTLDQVNTWLAQGYAIINQYLSAAGYTTPASDSAMVYPSFTALNELYAAAYALRALGLDVVQGEDENRSEIMLKDFFSRLKMMAGQDLTDLGLSYRATGLVKRRRVRTLQMRRVDGYSRTWGAVDEVSE